MARGHAGAGAPAHGGACGAALLTVGRYVGLEVQRAARIAAAGHGGQVVVSQAVVDQVTKFGYALPEGTRLRDLGAHRLPGLGRRERLAQLVLPAVPGLPSTFPPLRTQDAWPEVRANLVVVGGLTLVLLTLAGLLLPLAVPSFPRALGLVAGGAALVLLAVGGAGAVVLGMRAKARGMPWPQTLTLPLTLPWAWRDARKGMAAVVSLLLCLVIVVTTLFVTKPTLLGSSQQGGYIFSYTYHPPTHTGGAVTIGTWAPLITLAPDILVQASIDNRNVGLWNSCVVQLPDLTLGFKGWKADQCTEVPTVANGGESLDARTTIFHIDPRAVWSDGQPIIADDFLFTFHLLTNPDGNPWSNPIGSLPPWSLMHLTKLDVRTIRIEWSAPYGDYLTALAQLTPLPLHVYATGKFAGVYDPATGAYDAKLAKRLMADLSFNTKIPVDNGPFTVQDIVLNGPPVVFVGHTSQGGRVVLVKNPRFFSKFFHKPALDKVTIVSLWKDDKKHLDHTVLQEELIEAYRTGSMGGMTLALGLEPINLSHPGAIPKDEVVSSPYPGMLVMGFNQRGAAPNARANGGMSIFRDIKVRTAFMEAFDRCAAVQSVLGTHDCADPDLFTGELSVPPAPDHDSTVSLPAYNPANAAVLLDQAGYRVVGGLRRYKDGTTPLELTIPLSYHAFPYAGIAHRMQQDYQQHLKIVVKVVNAVNLFDSFDQGGLAQTGAFDVAVWGENFPLDPVGVLAAWGWDSASIPSAQNPNGYNWLGMIDPGVRAQDQLGSQEVDAGQRAEIYRNLARDVAQQVALEPLLIEADVALVQPTLCNFKKWPADGVNTWNMADWYLARGSTCP